MKKAKPPVTCETRYKHKLNMLEPGTALLQWIGILLLVGFILRLFRMKLMSYMVWGLAGTFFLLLLILLAIEAYQDSVLNESASQEQKTD